MIQRQVVEFMSVSYKFFKVYIKVIKKLKDAKEILMVSIVGIFLMGKDKGMVFSNGIMEKGFKGIGRKDSNVDLVFGGLPMEIGIKDNGLIIDSKGKGFLTIEIVYIQANSKIF
jgi:translation initiation factor 6 (eIF-6)